MGATTPDDAARAEATPTTRDQWWLVDILKALIEDVRDEPQFTDAEHALMGAGEVKREWLASHDAEVRADERAQIAARRDRSALVKRAWTDRDVPVDADDEWAFGEGVRAGVDAVLAALDPS